MPVAGDFVTKACTTCKHENEAYGYPSCQKCRKENKNAGWEMRDEEHHHDSHYQTEVQPLEVMQANMTTDEFVGFLKGNIIKYACRCGRKDESLKEAKKIQRYTEWLVKALKGEKIDPRK